MNQFYQQNSPLMPIRRATEPVTLAPTASMIDPNLENHRIQHSQLSPRYGGMQMGNPVGMPNQGNASMQTHPHGNGGIGDHSNGHTTPTFHHTHSGPPERGLPSRDVNDLSIDDAYIQFILYCNPSVPLEVDTTELRKGFRAPPKSDGKSFSPFTLYQLIARLDAKVIKTWTELVIELGVSPPDVSKNQSTQKVQQYAVRLKVFMPILYTSRRLCKLHASNFACADIMTQSVGFTLSTSTHFSSIYPTSPHPTYQSDPHPTTPSSSAKAFPRKKTWPFALSSPNGAPSEAAEKPTTSKPKHRKLPPPTKNCTPAPAAPISPACSKSNTPPLPPALCLGVPNPNRQISGQQHK